MPRKERIKRERELQQAAQGSNSLLSWIKSSSSKEEGEDEDEDERSESRVMFTV